MIDLDSRNETTIGSFQEDEGVHFHYLFVCMFFKKFFKFFILPVLLYFEIHFLSLGVGLGSLH